MLYIAIYTYAGSQVECAVHIIHMVLELKMLI